jgi:polyhydroxyalkanoate synthesis repressor PhaR
MTRANEPTVIKKYANRRLYNTGTSTYVTLDDLAAMTRNGEDFTVVDARTDADISHQVLTQIVLDLEGKAHSLLPPVVLRQLISLYGDGIEAMVPPFLERAITLLLHERQRLRADIERDLGLSGTPAGIDEHLKRHPDIVERALNRILPEPDATTSESPRPDGRHSEEFDLIKTQIEAMQRQLDKLTSPPAPTSGGQT